MPAMRRIGILTAGGDTPAINATIYGAVEKANELKVEVFGIMDGFAGMINPRMPHIHLNPLFSTIPELDPAVGGTMLGASRTYIDPKQPEVLHGVCDRMKRLGIEGLICIGGDGTINGMQPLSEMYPCVLAPKTIDNDLGLNYLDEPNEWQHEILPNGKETCRKVRSRPELDLEEIVNYATPGYATAVFVVVQGIQRIRTTAESHRRIGIVECMGRQSGYIALGSAYGQPDMILIPEVPLDMELVVERIRELYDLQKHVVVVLGEGVVDCEGKELGDTAPSRDPAGNIVFSGAGEQFKQVLKNRLGNEFFRGQHDTAEAAIFTRKVGHTQRGGRPIRFDRFYAAQLGGKAVELIEDGKNNAISILKWSRANGFELDSINANRFRDQSRAIHPRVVHPCLYDPRRFQPSRLGREYLMSIFTNAIGPEDAEHMRYDMFEPGSLTLRYQSVNIDVQKRIQYLPERAT